MGSKGKSHEACEERYAVHGSGVAGIVMLSNWVIDVASKRKRKRRWLSMT